MVYSQQWLSRSFWKRISSDPDPILKNMDWILFSVPSVKKASHSIPIRSSVYMGHTIWESAVVVFVLNNAWASGTVLRPFLQPESPLSSQSLVSGSKCKLRDSNSRPPYSRPRALTTRLCTIHEKWMQYYPVN